MFFNIQKKLDNRFAENIPLTSSYWFNCDEGWHSIQNPKCKIALVKGYCFDDCDFVTELINDPTPKHNGNFCLIYVNHNDEIIITHDAERSFPLFQTENSIGVIGIDPSTKINANTFVIIKNKIIKNKFFNTYNIKNNITLDGAANIILEILIPKFNWLKNNKIKPAFFFSGGVDTLTCLALLDYCGIDYKLLLEEHYDYDKFSINFRDDLTSNQKYWGYKQLNYYNKPCTIITGAMGDENFMRGPATIKFLLEYYKVNIFHILKPSDYHYNYFYREYNKKIFDTHLEPRLQIYTKDYKKLCDKIIDCNLNDHQHWHIGETISFTPFKDLNILSTVLSMDYSSIEKQITNAVLQKRIIEMASPKMLKYLTQQKNTSLSTLWQLIQDLK
jgi:hypothetical protein